MVPVDKDTFKFTHPAGTYAGHAYWFGEGCTYFVVFSTEMVTHPAGRMQGVLTVPPSRAVCWASLHRGLTVPASRAKCWACLVPYGGDGLFPVEYSVEVVTHLAGQVLGTLTGYRCT